MIILYAKPFYNNAQYRQNRVRAGKNLKSSTKRFCESGGTVIDLLLNYSRVDLQVVSTSLK